MAFPFLSTSRSAFTSRCFMVRFIQTFGVSSFVCTLCVCAHGGKLNSACAHVPLLSSYFKSGIFYSISVDLAFDGGWWTYGLGGLWGTDQALNNGLVDPQTRHAAGFHGAAVCGDERLKTSAPPKAGRDRRGVLWCRGAAQQDCHFQALWTKDLPSWQQAPLCLNQNEWQRVHNHPITPTIKNSALRGGWASSFIRFFLWWTSASPYLMEQPQGSVKNSIRL